MTSMDPGDVLSAYDEPAPAKRVPWLVAGGVGALVLALVAGVTYGVGALSGGGSQPESALPSGAFAFVKIDLDPSAGQKIDGFRFLRQFPALKDKLGGDDPRRLLFEAVAEDAGWGEVDFESEVAPWMGDRAGVAVYAAPGGDESPAEPRVVVALEVSDGDGARQGLAKLVTAGTAGGDDGPKGFVVEGDYALLAETQKLADAAARDATGATLDQDEDFSRDLAEAEDGVLTAWVDSAALVEAMGDGAGNYGLLGSSPQLMGGVNGRATYVARFDGPDAFEVSGRVSDADTVGWASRPVRGLAGLPASSVVAVGLADGDDLVTRVFESFRKAKSAEAPDSGTPTFDDLVSSAERDLGIELPEDLAVLLGDNLVAALDEESAEISVGIRVSTDVARAERVLDAAGTSLPLVRRRVGNDLVLASTQTQADRMASGGSLGVVPAFARSLPDLDEAHLAVWVDIDALATLFSGMGGPPEGEGERDENLAQIEGLGMTVSGGSERSATFRLRLVTR